MRIYSEETKEKRRAYSRQHWLTYKARHKILQKIYRDKLRNEIISNYGGKCTCCGEAEERFLCIDHIHNDGAKERRSIASPLSKRPGGMATRFYLWLKRNGFPKDRYQLLCHNCNWAKRYGECPHKKQKL